MLTKPSGFEFDKIYETDYMRIKSTCERCSLHIEWNPHDMSFISLYTDGGARVIFSPKEAGQLAAFLIRHFPLDALGQV